jgi:aldose 1-epimerase
MLKKLPNCGAALQMVSSFSTTYIKIRNTMKSYSLIVGASLLFFAACQPAPKNTETANQTPASPAYTLPNAKDFEKTVDGQAVHLYTLKNGVLQAAITNYGARMVAMLAPGKDGQLVDVIQGFSSIDGYLKANEVFFGAIVGRYGNRIAKGKFQLNGKSYVLPLNNGVNHLHGGPKGFQNVVWQAKQIDSSTLELHYLSKDMEQGYPGNLNVTVVYKLTADHGLEIAYTATTDKPTVLNITNHNFWNLDGERDSTINDHMIQIFATTFVPVDSTLIPFGRLDQVAGTPFDFRKSTAVGAHVNDKNEQLLFGKGYDHNFVLDKPKNGEKMILAAEVVAPLTGIKMQVLTEEPGLQFYGGNFLKGLDKGKSGLPYVYRSSLCLETQHFPDSPNQPQYPSTVLKPGETYQTKTVYRFGVK